MSRLNDAHLGLPSPEDDREGVRIRARWESSGAPDIRWGPVNRDEFPAGDRVTN